MAITETSTPKVGGGFGNRKVLFFELSGTYTQNGFALDFDPTDATIIINGLTAYWNTSTKKLQLGTIGTDSTSTFTELASDTSLASLHVTGGLAIF